jgi:tyrosine-protein kinase Etk/Wzc
MSKNKTEFNSNDLLTFVWKSRKILLILGILAVIISSVVSLLIEEKYKSTVTLYPAKSNSINYNETTTDDNDIAKFGEEAEAEQMLQIMESSKIRDKVISKFNLMRHYDIDTADKLKDFEISETYSDLISFSRNNKGAVTIEVLDKSPDTAMLMATYISELFDSTKNDIVHQRSMNDYLIKKENLDNLRLDMKLVRDTMSKLTKLGVVTQDGYEAITNAMTNAKDPETKKAYQQKILMTEKHGFILKSFEVEVENLAERIARMETLFLQAETNAFEDMSHRFQIESATKPYKKAYPVRWLIVVASTVSTVFFGFVLLLFYEKFKELKSLNS